jgi:hypothetical protein
LSYEIRCTGNEKQTRNGSVSFEESDVLRVENNFKLVNKSINSEETIIDARTWLYDKQSEEPVDSNWVHEESLSKESTVWRLLSPLFEDRRGIESIDGHAELRRYLGLDYHDLTLGNRFELAVSYLFTVLGFQVLFLGQPLHKKGIDVIAIDPDTESVLVISSTISNKIGEKIQTLLSESNRLKLSLNDVHLVPLIVTPIKMDDVKNSDRADASTHAITLLLIDQISELFNLASKSTQTEARQKSLKIISDSLGNQRLSIQTDT